MFQIVDPKEIFDQSFWQVSEQHPAYWLAQLRKKEWTRLLLMLSMKPAWSANKPILAGRVLERRVFKVCHTRLDVYKAWQTNPGSFIIQFRYSETGWCAGCVWREPSTSLTLRTRTTSPRQYNLFRHDNSNPAFERGLFQ